MSKIEKFIYSASLLLSFGLLSWIVFYHYFFYVSRMDGSLYAKAMDYITWTNLNPFVPSRQLHIFNDHFDVILIPFALTLGKVFPPLAVGYFLEIFFLLLSCFPFLYLYRRGEISSSVLVVSTLILVMSESIYNAVAFPFHPITWSIFPITLIGYFLFKDNRRGVVLSYLFLLLFKEIYVFIGFVLGCLYLFKDRKTSVLLFFITVTWYFIAFKLRYILGESSVRYDHSFLNLLSLAGLKSMLKTFFFGHKVFQHNLFALLPVLLLLGYARFKKIKIDFTTLFLLLPLLFMNFVMGGQENKYIYSPNYWTIHRVIFFSPLIAWCIVFTFKKEALPNWLIVVLFLFLLGVNGESLLTYPTLSRGYINNYPGWENKMNRRAAIRDAIKELEKYPDDNVYTNPRLLPYLRKNRYVYFCHTYFPGFVDGKRIVNENAHYNLLLFEKKEDDEGLEETSQWLRNGATTLIDNSYLFLLRMKYGPTVCRNPGWTG